MERTWRGVCPRQDKGTLKMITLNMGFYSVVKTFSSNDCIPEANTPLRVQVRGAGQTFKKFCDQTLAHYMFNDILRTSENPKNQQTILKATTQLSMKRSEDISRTLRAPKLEGSTRNEEDKDFKNPTCPNPND
ncbi:hypothetical protein HUJ04_011642 [Dendroctonus ponderosae]|nr:hypothetical protein HUJ04_011642 [Dendroctonus ponderosae]